MNTETSTCPECSHALVDPAPTGEPGADSYYCEGCGKAFNLDDIRIVKIHHDGRDHAMTTRTKIQQWIIGAAVHAAEYRIADVERVGATVNDRAGIITAVVHYALCEWTNDVSDTPTSDELVESASNVRDDLYSREWLATAIASIAPDAITWPAEEMDSSGASH